MEGTGAITARRESVYLAKNLLQERVREENKQFRLELVRNTLNSIDDISILRKTEAVLREEIIV